MPSNREAVREVVAAMREIAEDVNRLNVSGASALAGRIDGALDKLLALPASGTGAGERVETLRQSHTGCTLCEIDLVCHEAMHVATYNRALDDAIAALAPLDAASPPGAEREGVTEREELFTRIGAELDRAYAKHGRDPWGRHEFYAILLEEVDEMWADIKADAPDEAFFKELVQVAAMCFRYFETGDRYRHLRVVIEHNANHTHGACVPWTFGEFRERMEKQRDTPAPGAPSDG